MSQVDEFRDLLESVKGIGFHSDFVLGDDVEHAAGLGRAVDQGAVDADVAEDELGEGDGYFGGLAWMTVSLNGRDILKGKDVGRQRPMAGGSRSLRKYRRSWAVGDKRRG